VAGGFMVIILFGMLVMASRLAGGASPAMAAAMTMLVFLGGWVSGRVLQRFIFYRHRAALLFLFSGQTPAPCSLGAAIHAATRSFPSYSPWAALNRNLRHFLAVVHRGSDTYAIQPDAGVADLFAARPLSQAILTLAFRRGGSDVGRSAREGLALYLRHGLATRKLARQWLGFSLVGLAFLFLCLALPNWFFFKSAGAPVWIGVVLAAVIAWLLHQAFIIPFILAGLSAALLTETRGQTPDPGLCEKLASLFPDIPLPDNKPN
jgi:hypothetical protein